MTLQAAPKTCIKPAAKNRPPPSLFRAQSYCGIDSGRPKGREERGEQGRGEQDQWRASQHKGLNTLDAVEHALQDLPGAKRQHKADEDPYRHGKPPRAFLFAVSVAKPSGADKPGVSP